MNQSETKADATVPDKDQSASEETEQPASYARTLLPGQRAELCLLGA